jgi:hypothetical protein
MDLIGKTVRWGRDDRPGEWLTALVLYKNPIRDDTSYCGECIDPGTFTYIKPGNHVRLEPGSVTVIDSEPVTEDEECE